MKTRHHHAESLEPRTLLTALISGKSSIGHLTADAPTAEYSVVVKKDAEFVFHLVHDYLFGNSLESDIKIYDSQSIVMYDETVNGKFHFRDRAPANGEYRIEVTLRHEDHRPPNTVFRVFAFSESADVVTYSNGDDYRIAQPGLLHSPIREDYPDDLYELELEVLELSDLKIGHAITATANLSLGSELLLIDPDGRLVLERKSSGTFGVDHVAEKSGDYFIVVRGEYDFMPVWQTLVVEPNETVALITTSTKIESISSNETAIYSFFADPDVEITATIETVSGDAQPFATLISPDGMKLTSKGATSLIKLQSTTTLGGRHLLAIRDRIATTIGEFRIKLNLSSGDGGPTLRVNGTDSSERIVVESGEFPLYNVHVGSSVRYFNRRGYELLRIDAGGGDDYVKAKHNIRNYILGGPGKDTIFGSDKSDTITGGGGSDVIRDYKDHEDNGSNRINGGPGNDTIVGSNRASRIFGDAGNDRITGLDGTDFFFYGGSGNDRIIGAGSHDLIEGGPGNDSLSGGSGRDTIRGGSGNDRIEGGKHRDMLYGGDGDDSLYAGNVSLIQESGYTNYLYEDWLYGESGNDHFYNTDGRVTIHGGSGTDVAHFAEEDAEEASSIEQFL